MTVLDILIVSLGFSNDGTEVRGDVMFKLTDAEGEDKSLTMTCTCRASKRIRPDALLIGDAIRQLRRLPEVRSGEVRLKFAKGLKPIQQWKAA
ncbi:MAG: hypothetical protein AAF092_06310 [Pseudomonadota bacterium]